MNPAYIDRGDLLIFVTAGEDPQPIPDARVRITDPENGRILEEAVTDASGQTPFIELPAPPIEFSVAEGESEQRPYAVYNVTVSAGDRETLHIGGVEVMPTGRSIQRAALAPARTGGFNVRNLRLAPHALWGNPVAQEPEEQVKPLPEPGGLVVLPEPVIPEFVVVHDGRPDDASAPNYWVRFKDYIKNVACSEIYSTWKTEAIKANVLAILSFTLNRVYTEWYRGKGYDFTITSSTAFDQSFSYGRTIFEEIGVVVDDLFTTYITKEGIAQPLFTQYCDGRRVQCGGLSQWGSQALGEQGWDAVSILRKYEKRGACGGRPPVLRRRGPLPRQRGGGGADYSGTAQPYLPELSCHSQSPGGRDLRSRHAGGSAGVPENLPPAPDWQRGFCRVV